MTYKLIIFDMDGTLVQSEDCASQALIDVIPALNATAAEITARYRGMRLAEIFNDIERREPGAIPDHCLELYRIREDALSQSMITPSEGVETLLTELDLERCIASNAPVEKTRRSLDICGLSHHFQNNIYSAYEVQAWKPDPSLFVHAAASHHVAPNDCLVLEDSIVGIKAAEAAGMCPVFYAPHESSDVIPQVQTITRLIDLLELI
ncbi:MAG: HAD-IA family hydrolase [Granulosicoccus sp.]